MSQVIEFAIKNLLTKKMPKPGDLRVEFYQTFKDKLKPILKLFQIEKEGMLPKAFYETTINLIPK